MQAKVAFGYRETMGASEEMEIEGHRVEAAAGSKDLAPRPENFLSE
jgi:hypothetical protein